MEHHRRRGKLESRSDSPVIAPLNRNTAAIRSHPSSLALSFSPVTPFVLYRTAIERSGEREFHLSFSLFYSLVCVYMFLFLSSTPLSLSLSFSRTSAGTYAVCKSRRECVSVRITNRKRFSYLPFIKRNEHVRIDIRPISVYLGFCVLLLPPPLPAARHASPLQRVARSPLLLHARSSRDSITREK